MIDDKHIFNELVVNSYFTLSYKGIIGIIIGSVELIVTILAHLWQMIFIYQYLISKPICVFGVKDIR